MKGKEYVTIVKENRNKGYCHLQHEKKIRLSFKALKTKLTYRRLIEIRDKLQSQKLKLQIGVNITNSTKRYLL